MIKQNENMPKVSIIIPVYGVEKYIERCARSLFEQTLDDIEYLFIDDCTPDKSVEILKRVLEEYPHRKSQVVIHRMEQNTGQAKVREWGMRNATGEYVIHCDSDDWVDIHMYEEMYDKAVEENADVVVCDFALHDGKRINKIVHACGSLNHQEFLQRILFQRDPWSLWNKLFKRKVCYKDLIYPKGNMGEDMLFCIQMLLPCNHITYIPKAYYFYYKNSESISNKREKANHLRNFEYLKANTDLLIEILKKKKLRNLKWVINGLEYNATLPLQNLIHSDKKYRTLWFNTYPNAIWTYVINPYFDIKKRFKCLLAILGFYPFKKDRITM